MSRPYVTIKNNNIINELLNSLNNEIEEFKKLQDVVGIILDGGLSRGYGDRLSEIDVVIYLSKQSYQYYQKNLTPISLGITMINNYLYDIKILDYEEELSKSWDSVALWDISYAKILYDPENKVKEMIDLKLKRKPKISSASSFMFDSWWNFKLATDIWINRADPLQGHYILNNAIKPLISALFIANNEYIPHDKWIIHMSKTLEYLPDNYEETLNLILCSNISLEGLIERQKHINALWNQIDQYLKANDSFNVELNYSQKWFYDLLLNLVDNGYTLEEWEKVASFSTLNNPPFYQIIKIENNIIQVDKEKLLNIQPKDMYSWFYEILDIIRKDYI